MKERPVAVHAAIDLFAFGQFGFGRMEVILASAENLTLSEFQLKYEQNDRAYEYWHGRAMPKSIPTWIHGYLQGVIMRLLQDAGYLAGSEIEQRIVADARPKPDVIATLGKMEIPYPTDRWRC